MDLRGLEGIGGSLGKVGEKNGRGRESIKGKE